MINKRAQGNKAEDICAYHLEQEGYRILHRNFTIRGGELDIVTERDNLRIFIEVKEVNTTQNLHDYISKHKLESLIKTINFYNLRYPTKLSYRLDLVFIKENHILTHCKNITNT